MQAQGGMIIDGGMIVLTPSSEIVPVSGSANVTLGTTVEWASNTWLYIAEGRANASLSSEYAFDTNNMVWQLFYAHRSIRLPVSSGAVSPTGGGARWSTIVRQSGTNNPQLYGAIANVDANLSEFKSNTDTALSGVLSINYTANTLWQGNISTALTIPANRFFLLGVTGGPYYKDYRRTANNYTAVSGGNAIVTVINTAYTAGWPSGPARGVPTAIGGNTSGYTKLTGNILLAAFKFEIV